jgi:exonuclease SbcC
LKLSPGINIIRGTSNSGKSAIVRALKWLMMGVPKGTSFCSSWNDGKTSVGVVLDTGDKISRSVQNKKQRYRFNNRVFENITNDIPREIAEAFNIDETNIQSQYDSPFLISETPGNINKYFNQLLNLGFLDYCSTTLNGEIRDTKFLVHSYDEEITSIKEELKKYESLPVLVKIVDRLRVSSITSLKIGEEVTNVTRLVSAIRRVEAVYSLSVEKRDNLYPSYEALRLTAQKTQSLFEQLNNLRGIILKIKRTSKKLREKKRVALLKNQYETYLVRVYLRDKVKKEYIDIRSLVEAISTMVEDIKERELQHKEAKKEWSDVFPAVCPLCGSPKHTVHS